MLQTADRHAAVREHYRQLAPEYGARANRTCETAYVRLLQRFLGDCRAVLELGAGSSDFLQRLGSPLGVACDLSLDMLRRRPPDTSHGVVAAGEQLPFQDAAFDGLFLINVLEHVADVDAVLTESARVLREGGRLLAVTPNGDWEFWLDLAERWSLKLPEGPHAFLTPQRLLRSVAAQFEVIEQRTFLVLPAGPLALAGLIDQLTFSSTLGLGFFQYIVGRKRA